MNHLLTVELITCSFLLQSHGAKDLVQTLLGHVTAEEACVTDQRKKHGPNTSVCRHTGDPTRTTAARWFWFGSWHLTTNTRVALIMLIVRLTKLAVPSHDLPINRLHKAPPPPKHRGPRLTAAPGLHLAAPGPVTVSIS